MDVRKYDELLKRSEKLIYKAGWGKWQEKMKNDSTGEFTEQLIEVLELISENNWEAASEIIKQKGKEQGGNLLKEVVGFSKQGPRFAIYYVDNHGTGKMPPEMRQKYEARQEDYDNLGRAEQKKQRVGELKATITELERQLAAARRELEQLESR